MENVRNSGTLTQWEMNNIIPEKELLKRLLSQIRLQKPEF
jgi:hypothetical protein